MFGSVNDHAINAAQHHSDAHVRRISLHVMEHPWNVAHDAAPHDRVRRDKWLYQCAQGEP